MITVDSPAIPRGKQVYFIIVFYSICMVQYSLSSDRLPRHYSDRHLEMLAHENETEGKADVLRDWVANKGRDLKARSGGHESMNVKSATRSGTGALACLESSMRARLYVKCSIDKLLKTHARSDTHTHAG
jgi:hypothetical protein